MALFRILLVAILALSASVSGAMDARHATVMEHSKMAASEVIADQPVCCSESSERSQTCHVLSALLPGADHDDTAPATCQDMSFGGGLLLTGFEPSGPLDPPRAV
ncbi:hypothetical protein [Tateyamaria pelophila]|uniref:hypothetical protein n=1 Tax=Tateyamaria pelophila TaxID=328415 RepID=UPI001CBED065|nr:hypothetical protein [Tateyamaria pelophila]